MPGAGGAGSIVGPTGSTRSPRSSTPSAPTPDQLGREAYTEGDWYGGPDAVIPAGYDQLIPALAGNYRLLTGLPVTRIDHGGPAGVSITDGRRLYGGLMPPW